MVAVARSESAIRVQDNCGHVTVKSLSILMQVYKAIQDDCRAVAVKVASGDMQDLSSQKFWKEIQLIADLRDR